ncbi:hypothetical protein F511_07838 [Dorcoceras hygrometricum]|uniref:Uncharacterized protein n=1 Tax=Dorcoceras hygrometricum TaxID=472368 RepID=A0A2Z7B625_9LAMI|nr:hypothetical protein F511_07838 [Dorcoceras hygrometricum]
MSLFDLQDVCIAIGSIATLDLPMVVDLIGIYGLKGPYDVKTSAVESDVEDKKSGSSYEQKNDSDVRRRCEGGIWIKREEKSEKKRSGSSTKIDLDSDVKRGRFNYEEKGEAAAVDRQSGPRPETIFLQSSCTRKLMDFSTDRKLLFTMAGTSPARGGGAWPTAAARGKRRGRELAVGPKPLRLRNHDFRLAQRIMVKRLATSRHDPLGITDSACKNQLVVVSVQYGPFNTYIPIRSTTIDIIGYSRMRASGESSTMKHRLLHASGSHPIPPPNVPKVSMTFRVVRTNQYNQDLGLIHSTNGNNLESRNEDSSIDHQVTIHLHAQNITMFPTNETWYFASQMLVSSSGGLILIFTAQSTRNKFRIHSDY